MHGALTGRDSVEMMAAASDRMSPRYGVVGAFEGWRSIPGRGKLSQMGGGGGISPQINLPGRRYMSDGLIRSYVQSIAPVLNIICSASWEGWWS